MTSRSDPSGLVTRHRARFRGLLRRFGLGTVSRVGAVVLLTLTGSLALPRPADAHTDLTSSSPSASDAVRVPPETVRLEFNDNLSKDFVSLTLTVNGQKPVPVRSEVSGGTVTAAVPSSLRATEGEAPQRWLLAYRVVSADAHPVTGTVSFTVTAPSGAAPSQSGSTPSAGPSEPAASPDAPEGLDSAAQKSGTDPGFSTAAWVAVLGAATAGGVVLFMVARGRRRTGADEQ